MKLIRKFIRFMNPSIETDIQADIDRRSLSSIHVISLVCLLFESVMMVVFLSAHIGKFDHNTWASLFGASYCIVLCGFSAFLSRRMLRMNDFPHNRFFLFKIFFFVAFTAWAIFVDYRQYCRGDQILTFHAVNLVMICFVIFRPWIGSLLISASFIGLFVPMYLYNRAEDVEVLNLILLALASMASNAIRCHVQIHVSTNKMRLVEANKALENASRRDGLTGLQNRLALDDDIVRMKGRETTAFMIDVNYFKELNDRCGHVAGDIILKDVSEALKHLFPGGHYYRYGGDEFLVLTHKSPEQNYGADTYDFTQEKYGAKVSLSIGNAHGHPENTEDLFALISEADKSLYITKARTHSAEFGGHDRRKSVSQ